MLVHVLWAQRPGKDEPEEIATFSLARWQWAEKMAAYLRDKGFTSIEIKTVEEDE